VKNRLKGYRRKAWLVRHPSQVQQGLTLIECLVAIIVAGLVGSAIAPALVISVATRVQSQKAEQALELAQTEIDSVRLLMERSEANTTTLPPSAPFSGAYGTDAAVALAAGPNAGAPVTTPTTATQTRLVDLNGHQFAVQTYRTPGEMVGSVPLTFNLGVRVYDLDTVLNGNGSLPQDPAALGLTSGVGQRADRPLVALYTSMTAGENGNSLCSYIRYLDGTAAVPVGCN
jgi:prepilin-type N-terminal cleavage/methylation domain-containing protein